MPFTPLSYVEYTGDAVTTSYAVPFAFLERTHVKVLLDDVEQTVITHYTWASDTEIIMVTAPGSGVVVRVERETPLPAIVDFTDASLMTESNLDLNNLQLRYINEETRDDGNEAAEDATSAADADATAAAASAAAALTSETNAATSETNAAASAAAAATSASNAATSETNAATSETNAATSASNAATSETNAAASEAATLNLDKATTKGDIVGHNGTAYARVPVGTDGQALLADSADAEGLTWTSLDHGTHIGGLGDDDHTQYALLSGRAGDKLTLADSATTAPLSATERASAPSSPASGDLYLDDGTNTASGNPGWRRYTGSVWEDVGAGGGGSGESISIAITAASKTVGDCVLYDGTDADASAAATADAVGVIESISGSDNTVILGGKITLASGTWPESATAGDSLFLSETAGALTKTAPSATDTVYLPVVKCLSTTTGIVNPNWGIVNGGGGGGGSSADSKPLQGRLTLETLVPVSTTDQDNKTTLYLTPYNGNQVALYDGSSWSNFDLTEISITNGGLAVDTNYDVFVYDSSGLTLELVAWTNDTTRATALVLQDGVYVKSGATARRYVGSIHTVDDAATAKFADTKSERYVWNAYNKVSSGLIADATGADHTYQTATWREFNAGQGLGDTQVSLVVGLSGDELTADVYGYVYATTGSYASLGVGVDSTSTNSAQIYGGYISTTGGSVGGVYSGTLAVGKHDIYLLQYATAGGTVTWPSDAHASRTPGLVANYTR